MALPVADLIVENGPIWCGANDGIAEAVAIWQGHVLATGTKAEIASLAGRGTRRIDLGGRLATPGLNDSHLHLVALGLTMGWVDARPAAAPTLAALLARIGERARALGPGKWVLARGYDQTKLDVLRHPLRDELEILAAPDNPVVLIRTCGHISIASSKALALAGINERSPVPQGGLIEQRDGRLSAYADARLPLTKAMPPLEDEELVDGIERGGKYLLSYGITSCMDAAVGHRGGFAEIAAYQKAKRTGRLPVRTWLTLLGDPGAGIVAKAHDAGMVSGTGDDMLMTGAVKIFLDGSAGGRTAWMSKPYLGADATCGVAMLRDNELTDLVLDYHAKGYQLACHAIGDAAIGQLIGAYEKALTAMPIPTAGIASSIADTRRRTTTGACSPARHLSLPAAGVRLRLRRRLCVGAGRGTGLEELSAAHLDGSRPQAVDGGATRRCAIQIRSRISTIC